MKVRTEKRKVLPQLTRISVMSSDSLKAEVDLTPWSESVLL